MHKRNRRNFSMFNAIKINILSQRAALVIGTHLFAALALLPATAGGQCTQWDVSGKWNIEVKSGVRKGYVARVSVLQSGKSLSGEVLTDGESIGVATFKNGTSDGDRFGIYLTWDGKGLDGSNVEVYAGTIGSNGMIEGTALLIGDRSGNAAWSSDRSMRCLVKPPKSTGKAKPVKAEPTPMKVPGIVASQVIFPSPYSAMGFVILTWDAGPDNPYAEVWFKVNNAEDIFLVEQGKGSRQIPVERGKYYTYILTDAGKTLSTVSFVGR
jgi:hypothetical protein